MISRFSVLVILFSLGFKINVLSQDFKTEEFLFGACVYPEILTRQESQNMLDYFDQAHINIVRVAESGWGVIEKKDGVYDFQWLDEFLEDSNERNIKAILGTVDVLA